MEEPGPHRKVAETAKTLHALLKDVELELLENDLLRLAECILSDDSSFWPLQKNFFYLGKFPSLTKYINVNTVKNEILRRRVVSHVSTDWRSTCWKELR